MVKRTFVTATLNDAYGEPIQMGDTVAFYFANAEVKKGTVVRLSQSVYEHRRGSGVGKVYVTLEPGGSKYIRQAGSVVLLRP